MMHQIHIAASCPQTSTQQPGVEDLRAQKKIKKFAYFFLLHLDFDVISLTQEPWLGTQSPQTGQTGSFASFVLSADETFTDIGCVSAHPDIRNEAVGDLDLRSSSMLHISTPGVKSLHTLDPKAVVHVLARRRRPIIPMGFHTMVSFLTCFHSPTRMRGSSAYLFFR